MGLPVLVLGQSGTGKSASLRHFGPSKVAVINVAGKPLPFKNKIESVTTDEYKKVIATLKKYAADGKKSIVIDDAQYLMANEFMRRATERGFDKFTEIAQNFWVLVNSVKELPEDVIVYFLAHIEVDANGNEKIKTIGKLLDEKITVEGMFTIVLKTNVTDGTYSFLTQNNGHDTTKSPIGMFPTYAIDNDLHYVDEKIRNYYEMGEFLSDDEMAEIDREAERVNFEPKQEGEKKSRRSRKADTNSEAEQSTTGKRENVEADASAGGEQPKRRRRVSDDMAEERAAVEQQNTQAVVNAGMEEAGDNEEVEFDKVEMPATQEMPRRKRRGASNESEQKSGEQAEENAETEEKEEPAQTNTGETRTRRRRGSEATTEEAPAMNPPEDAEATDDQAPARRRRRRG